MIEIIRKANLNLITILLLILVFVNPLLYIDGLRDAASLPRYAFLGFISGIGLIIWLNVSFRCGNSIFVHYIYIPIIIFLLWSALSISWSVDPKNAVIEIIQFSGLILIAFLVSQIFTKERLILIVIASIVSASIVSLIGIQQYFYFNPFNFVQYSRPGSTFTGLNFVSIYIDLIVPVAFMFFLTLKSKYAQWFFALCFSLCLSFLLLSRTRGSWISLLLVVIVLLILLYKNDFLKEFFVIKLKSKRMLILASLCLPIILLNLPSGSYKGGYTKLAFDGSANIRLTGYVNSLSMIKDKPLIGTGIGGFRLGFRPYMFSILPLKQANVDIYLQRLHNDPMQFIVELGIPVGLLLIVVFIVLMVLIWQVIKHEKDKKAQLIYFGIFLSLIASGTHSLVDFPLHKPSSAIQLSIWFGALIGYHMRYIQSNKISLTKSIRIPLFVLAIVYLITNILFYSKYIESSIYLKKSQSSFLDGECELSKNQIKVGNEIFGLDFLSQTMLVQMHSFCKTSTIEKLDVMNSAIDYDSTNTRARLTRGYLFLSLGDYSDAKKDFNVIINILPNRAIGYIGLGNVAVSERNYKYAKIYFEEALLIIYKSSDETFEQVDLIQQKLKEIRLIE